VLVFTAAGGVKKKKAKMTRGGSFWGEEKKGGIHEQDSAPREAKGLRERLIFGRQKDRIRVLDSEVTNEGNK